MGYTTGDTKPLTGRCTTKDGQYAAEVGVDLAGATLAVHVKQPDAVILTLVGTAGADGAWTADWPAPIVQAGWHDVEVQVTFAGGTVQTFGPSRFHVREQLA